MNNSWLIALTEAGKVEIYSNELYSFPQVIKENFL
jgi:hypothetical protein